MGLHWDVSCRITIYRDVTACQACDTSWHAGCNGRGRTLYARRNVMYWGGGIIGLILLILLILLLTGNL